MILLIRDPFDTLLAEFNRRKSQNHTGLAPLQEFQTKNWQHYVEKTSNEWKDFYKFFAENYKAEQLHVIKYEDLKSDLIKTLKNVVSFLGLPSLTNKNCVFTKRQGTNHRPKSKIDLKQFYSPVQTNLVSIIRNSTYDKLGVR